MIQSSKNIGIKLLKKKDGVITKRMIGLEARVSLKERGRGCFYRWGERKQSMFPSSTRVIYSGHRKCKWMASKQSGLFLQADLRKEVQRPDIRLTFVHTMDGGLTYFPLIFHPGSALSRRSAVSSPSGPRPTTTSLLMVLKLAITGAPAELAIGPIATSNGVLAGAAQSYVNFRWFRSPLKNARSDRDK